MPRHVFRLSSIMYLFGGKKYHNLNLGSERMLRAIIWHIEHSEKLEKQTNKWMVESSTHHTVFPIWNLQRLGNRANIIAIIYLILFPRERASERQKEKKISASKFEQSSEEKLMRGCQFFLAHHLVKFPTIVFTDENENLSKIAIRSQGENCAPKIISFVCRPRSKNTRAIED